MVKLCHINNVHFIKGLSVGPVTARAKAGNLHGCQIIMGG